MALIIQKGTDGGVSFPIKDGVGAPINLTGWSATAQIRSLINDSLIHTFSAANSNIALASSTITLVWTAAESSAWKWSQAKYGIELTNPDGKKARVKQDLVMLSDEVVK